MVDLVHALVVADSDLVIDFLRGRGPGAAALRRWLTEGRLRVTAVTVFELRVGTDYLERQAQLATLFARRTLPLDTLGALHAGEAHARLQAAGRGIGLKDSLQAGICKRFGLPLATRNTRHLERVEGLRLVSVEA